MMCVIFDDYMIDKMAANNKFVKLFIVNAI